MRRNGFTKALMALSLVGLLAAPALATNWLQIGPGHYIDSHSVKPANDYGTYTFDTKYLAKEKPLEYVNNQGVWTIHTHSYIDCRNAYGKTLSYTALDSNEKKLVSNNNIGKQWFGINNPGSKAYESYLFVCTDKYLNEREGYNPLWWY